MNLQIFSRRFAFQSVILLSLIFLSATCGGAQVIQIQRFGDLIPAQGAEQDGSPELNLSLKTDLELEAVLEKAERFRKEGQYGVAAKLWQTVLAQSGDTLYSSDKKIFYSMAERVEAILRELPADEGLDAYRISADADARALLAAAGDPYDQDALRQIVRLYFVSSIGDDAAFTLSSIYMDQFDFVGALRMLDKIARLHPDPSVSIVEVHTRMALCQAMMGEAEMARQEIAEAYQRSGSGDNHQLAAVEESVADLADRRFSQRVASACSMTLSNRNRSGLMKALPEAYLKERLQAVWQYYFSPKTRRWADLQNIEALFGPDQFSQIDDSLSPPEESLVERWRKHRWRPAGTLLFDEEHVYFKTSMDLTAWDRRANSGQCSWRTVWRNHYQMDQLASIYSGAGVRRIGLARGRRVETFSGRDSSQPSGASEVQLFNDRVAAQMSIQNGTLYTIEGTPFNKSFDPNTPLVPTRQSISYRRSRNNQLTAYDAKTGRLQWTLPRTVVGNPPAEQADQIDGAVQINEQAEDSAWLSQGGFMAAPIQFGELIIVPVNQGGAISIYALDPENKGKTVWKSYLCEEPPTGANPHSAINLSIDGSDLFASCGLGVVFVLDPTTGLVRFAKPYPRGGTDRLARRVGRQRGGARRGLKFDNWSSDTIFAYGRQMICFSSDAAKIEALDRTTGETIWHNVINPLGAKVDYIIGIHDDILYVGGPQTVLAFNLAKEGAMQWGGTKLFGEGYSYGRAMVSPNGVFVPVEDEIYVYSLDEEVNQSREPKLLKKIKVDLGTGAPVGNLFSDGERIWVHGANRIYALGALD